MNEINYLEHAKSFFIKNHSKYLTLDETDFESSALNYIKRESEFRYKEKVEGDTLVMILENQGFLKFTNRINNIRYHLITEKGIEFLKEHSL